MNSQLMPKKQLRICGLPSVLAMLMLSSMYSLRAQADEDYSEYHPVTSMEAFSSSGNASAITYSIAAEHAMKNKNYNQAIKLCQEAIDKDNDDVDIHLMYAKCLQKKLKTQTEKDPELFNKCVKEWVIVFKNEVGDEKGMSYKGATLPFMTEAYKDDERSIPAKQNLITLTGTYPKFNETSAKFLKRVSKPASTSVSGTVISVGGSDAPAHRQMLDRKETKNSPRKSAFTDTSSKN
jgi:tetratricopeptide (TPR) repeat protein